MASTDRIIAEGQRLVANVHRQEPESKVLRAEAYERVALVLTTSPHDAPTTGNALPIFSVQY